VYGRALRADRSLVEPQKQDRNRLGRFERGTSGNPGGRPKRGGSIAAELRRLSIELAPASPESAGRRETWAHRIARVILERAAEGDLRAAALALERLDGRVAPASPEPELEVTIERLPAPPA